MTVLKNNFTFSKVVLAFWILSLTLLVLSQTNPGITLPDRDYGIFSYVGQQIVEGKLPYKDAWDHKPPAIFYMDALGLWLGHGFRWGIWALEFVSLALASWLSYSLIKKLWGVLPAVCAVAIWLIGLNLTLQGGNTTEEFPLPLHFLVLILLIRLAESPTGYMDGLLLGMAFSISFLFRANNAMVETAVVLTLLLIWISQRKFNVLLVQMTSMAVGALLPILITMLYFVSQGIFKEMFDASITYNLIYSETKISNTFGFVGGIQYLGAIAWIGLIGYGLVLFQLVVQWRSGTKPSAILLFLLIGCPFAVAVTDPAQRNYGHYFINWLPFIAPLSGLIVYTIQNKLKHMEFPETLWVGVALGITVVIFLLSGLAVKNWNAFLKVFSRSDIELNSTVAVFVQDHTRRDDTVFFWGGFPGENFMARRESPSPYITYPLLLDASLSEEMSKRFLLDLNNNRPVLIVDMNNKKALSLDPEKRAEQLASNQEWPYLPSNINEVFDFIESNYQVDATFRNATVYRLKGTSAP